MKIGFIGAGNMAEAIIKGVLAVKVFKPEEILISDIKKDRLDYLKGSCKVAVAADSKSLIEKADVIVIAVKPKDVDAVLSGLKSSLKKDTLIVSIAAGISIKYIEDKVYPGASVIRVMPNTPALICEGMAALSKGKNVSKSQLETAMKILGATGKVVEVNEKYMDAVTAVSGSGPAYVFFFFEALSEAAVKLGLEKETADILAFNTIYGAAKMVLETKEDPSSLRNKVTSPGGTTLAALKVFEKKGFKEIVFNAVKAASDRSKELTK